MTLTPTLERRYLQLVRYLRRPDFRGVMLRREEIAEIVALIEAAMAVRPAAP